jgi:hypothetical protein
MEQGFSHQVVKVANFKSLAHHIYPCGFESCQGLQILLCKEAIQLACERSAGSTRNTARMGILCFPPTVMLDSVGVT